MQSDVMQCPVMSCEDAMYRNLLQRMSSRCTVMWCDVWCDVSCVIWYVMWGEDVMYCCHVYVVMLWCDEMSCDSVMLWCDVMCCELLRNVCCNVMWCAMHEQQEAGGRRRRRKDGVPKENKNPNRTIWGIRTPIEQYGEKRRFPTQARSWPVNSEALDQKWLWTINDNKWMWCNVMCGALYSMMRCTVM